MARSWTLDRALIIDDARNNRVDALFGGTPRRTVAGTVTEEQEGQMAVAEERTVPPALEDFAGRVLSPVTPTTTAPARSTTR